MIKRPRKTTAPKPPEKDKPLRTKKRAQKPPPVVQGPSEEGIGIFPNEILTNILSRLSAKSLLRYKSVSKWWYLLVSSPQLPALHLQRSLETSSNNLALVFGDESADCSVELDKVENFDMTVSVKVDCSKAGGFLIVGSCNGLVCLRAEKDNAILYNPATQTRYDLPTLPWDSPDHEPDNPEDPEDGYSIFTNVKFGFGYDSTCHDYKVWRISVFSSYINNCAFAIIAEVYSLKANKWTRVKDFPKNIGDIESQNGVLCNETLHWVAGVRIERSYSFEIVGVELHGEKYRQLPGPNHGFEYYEMSLGVLDGCLCVTYTPSQSNVRISVWVMKDYGSHQESWTRLFDIGRDQMPFQSARPLTYSKSGDGVLVLTYSGLLWYDLRNAKIKDCLSWKYSSAEVCMQTLVSPKTGSFHKNEEQRACGPFVRKCFDPYYVLPEPYYSSDDSCGYYDWEVL